MEKNTTILDDTLLNYLDGTLSLDERMKLEHTLQQNTLLTKRLEELRSVHQILQHTQLEQPSKNFTQLVMSKLDGYAERANFSIRNGILLLVGVLVAVGIVALLVSSGMFDQTQTAFDLNAINLPKQYIQKPLPTIPFNGKLFINVVIALNLGLAWLVLDRAILKPYFQRRMEMR